jgi:hypothetical protein
VLALLAHSRELSSEICLEIGGFIGGQAVFRVVLGHQLFDGLDADSPLLAVRSLLVATETDEVWIRRAVAVGVVADDQPTATAAAVKRALEVVAVNPVLLALDVAAREEVLHLLPGLDRNQCRMLAVVLDAVPRDFADVVRAAQEPVQLTHRDWFGRPLWSGHRR